MHDLTLIFYNTSALSLAYLGRGFGHMYQYNILPLSPSLRAKSGLDETEIRQVRPTTASLPAKMETSRAGETCLDFGLRSSRVLLQDVHFASSYIALLSSAYHILRCNASKYGIVAKPSIERLSIFLERKEQEY